MRYALREGKVGRAFSGIAIVVFLPLALLLVLFSGDEARRGVRDIFLNFLFLIATFILILFINWQIRQHGW